MNASAVEVRALFAMMFGVSLCFVGEAFAQSIVLRDLSRISPALIQDLDDESLTLADGRQLSWDRVLQAGVDAARQQQIERHVREIGEPLYRLKHRLRQSDVAGAYRIAQQWYQQDRRFAGAEANYLVCRAIMLGRLDEGQRERAMVPLLQSLRLQQQCDREFLESLPEIVFTAEELKVGILPGFLPVWSSPEAALEQLKRLSDDFEIDKQVAKWPGLAVYLSSLAIDAGQREQAINWNALMQLSPQLRPWQRVLNTRFSQVTLATLTDGDALTDGLEGGLRTCAMYWWASDPDQQAAKTDRVLTLLKIVANEGQRHPRIAKMALARSIEMTNDAAVRSVLQSESQ